MGIVVDKRTELMSIILALSQGNEYIEEHFCFNIDDNYRKRALEHFKPFKNHRAVKLAKQLAVSDEGFNFDNPIRLAFSLNQNLQFGGVIEKFLLLELENEKLLKEFMKEVVNFCKDSSFNEFYNLNKSYYLEKINQIKSLFNQELFICELQKFLKFELKEKFKINIIPMLLNANHGFKVRGVNFANVGLPSENFKSIDKFNNGYSHIIIHEFVHNFVNCYTKNNKLQLPNKFSKILKSAGYANPIAYLNDTIVRAITIRLREKINKINAEDFLERENRFGFVYVKKTYEQIVKYEKQNVCWNEYFNKLIPLIIKQ